MFKSIGTTLITGFITILPVVLTIYLLYWMVVSSEEVMGTALRYLLPDVYFPGMGTLAGLAIVFVVGLLMKAVLVRQLFAFGENILFHLPIIKTVYRAIRDLFDFFSPKQENFDRVVIVNFNDMEVIGFITQDDPQRLPDLLEPHDEAVVDVAVLRHRDVEVVLLEPGVRDRLADVVTAESIAAIAQIDCLRLTRGRSGRRDRPPVCTAP